EVVAQAVARMMAVDMHKAQRLLPELAAEFRGANLAAVGLPGDEAVARDAVRRAIGEEAALDAGVRPVETVDAERGFARRQPERHGDKETTLEGADFRQRADNAHFALAADQMAANGGGKARGHAGHAPVAVGEVAVDRRVTAGDIDHGKP